MLDVLDGWIDEIPPLQTPQRFGNLAFRKWGKRLEDVSVPDIGNLRITYNMFSGMQHAVVRVAAARFSCRHTTPIALSADLFRLVHPHGLRNRT